jgi:hypothetical protein
MLQLSQDPDWRGPIDGKAYRGDPPAFTQTLPRRCSCRETTPKLAGATCVFELPHEVTLAWCYVWLGVVARMHGRSPDEPHAHFRLEASAASAFRTSDCEIPNCRAIRDGVIPALKAARTAFNFPLVNESGASSNRRLRELSSKAGGFLPRRCCSAKATATNWSSSASASRFIAFGRSLGRMCRTALPVGDDGGGVAGGEKCSRPGGNRSGVVEPMRPLRMFLSCRRHRRVARAVPCPANTLAGSIFQDRCRFRIGLSRISRSSLDLALLKMRSSRAVVCDRIRTKRYRASH